MEEEEVEEAILTTTDFVILAFLAVRSANLFLNIIYIG